MQPSNSDSLFIDTREVEGARLAFPTSQAPTNFANAVVGGVTPSPLTPLLTKQTDMNTIVFDGVMCEQIGY